MNVTFILFFLLHIFLKLIPYWPPFWTWALRSWSCWGGGQGRGWEPWSYPWRGRAGRLQGRTQGRPVRLGLVILPFYYTAYLAVRNKRSITNNSIHSNSTNWLYFVSFQFIHSKRKLFWSSFFSIWLGLADFNNALYSHQSIFPSYYRGFDFWFRRKRRRKVEIKWYMIRTIVSPGYWKNMRKRGDEKVQQQMI